MGDFDKLIKNAPKNFGVYNFIDKEGAIIYVGKARNLKNRLTSYTKNISYRMQTAVNKTCDVRWFICKNEAEALLLENEQIKKNQPRYNILLKDDKTFPEILIDMNHDFPAIKYHRGPRKLNGKYFGPFANTGHVKSVIDTLKKTTLIRGCKDGDFSSRIRPCLEYQIGRCTAPCVGKVNKDEYLGQIKDAELILQGKSDVVQKNYIQKMNEYSSVDNFEKAQQMQAKIESLTYISNAVKSKIKNKDPLIKYLQESHEKGNKNILDKVKGLGEKRKKALLLHFGSIDSIKNASLNDIANVGGIGLKIAKIIFDNKI